MSITFRQLQQHFFAEAGPVDLRGVSDAATLEEIRAAMDQYGVIVFHDQPFTDEDQLDFARRFDGELHMKTGASAIQKSRFGNEALSDISNLDENGEIMASDDRRRMYVLGNRLWHTDASFQDPPGRYSMLHARIVPSVPADTQFADMRAAYDALPTEMKERLVGLRVHHSIAHSRQTLGFEFSDDELALLQGAVHPLVRELPYDRRTLYLASHASRIIDWPTPEGRLLLRDLMEGATRDAFTYTHSWKVGDLVIWDNRATMHRGLAYDDTKHRRDLRRVTTLDLPRRALASEAAMATAATA
jgi:alpha-ketoglutarate-dependent 2,4-dichlorophenoxyacetate dioxygenase